MDTEAVMYSGEGRRQTDDCELCVKCQPLSAVKLLYKDCLQDVNKELVVTDTLR